MIFIMEKHIVFHTVYSTIKIRSSVPLSYITEYFLTIIMSDKLPPQKLVQFNKSNNLMTCEHRYLFVIQYENENK